MFDKQSSDSALIHNVCGFKHGSSNQNLEYKLSILPWQ